MDIQLIVSVTLTILSTQAENCSEKQHCSNCSSITKQCITDCFPGYFDLKCKSPCSKRCKNSECTQTGTGIPKCSDGCVPGFYGTQCNIPCTRPRGSCTECPQGCDGTFCNLTSSCVSGCHDSYYGSDCKTCSRRCRSCNRITGTCNACHDPYSGQDCQFSCEDCSITNCVQACAPALYGRTCSKMCSENCVSYPAANTNHTVTSTSSTSCTSECHRSSGECIHGRGDGPNVAVIGTSTALVLFVFGTTVTVCIFLRKRASANRRETHQMAAIRRQSDTNKPGISPRRLRMSGHIYDEVNEDDMGPVIVFL